MDNTDKIGAAIKKARKRRKLTQEQLAELLDVTPAHIKHIESGRRKPSVDILFSAASLLNFSIDALINAQRSSDASPILDLIKLLDDCSDHELRLITDIIKAVQANR